MPITAWSRKALGAALGPDGSTHYAIVIGGDAPERIVVRRNLNSWLAGEPEPVTGLPADAKGPGDLTFDGITFTLIFRSGGQTVMAISTDEMATWTMVGD
jgi:hypothetical protein